MVLVSAWEKGEGERRSDAMGRARVLACPETCPCTLWRVLASLGTSWSGQRRALLGQGLYQQGQGDVGNLFDKVRERGEECDMVSMVVVTKGMAWPLHGSSMHFSWSMRAM